MWWSVRATCMISNGRRLELCGQLKLSRKELFLLLQTSYISVVSLHSPIDPSIRVIVEHSLWFRIASIRSWITRRVESWGEKQKNFFLSAHLTSTPKIVLLPAWGWQLFEFKIELNNQPTLLNVILTRYSKLRNLIYLHTTANDE